jgi:hypothetical protein
MSCVEERVCLRVIPAVAGSMSQAIWIPAFAGITDALSVSGLP